jgi:NADH dehydrogenase
MAGTLAEIARHTLPGEFRNIDPAHRASCCRRQPARAAGDAGGPERARRPAAGKLGVEVRTARA